MAEETKNQEVKNDASIGFVLVLAMVAAFTYFMMWVWSPDRVETVVEAGQGGGGGGAAPMVMPVPEDDGSAAAPSMGTARKIVEFALLSPVAGTSIGPGVVIFEGTAFRGTTVVVMGDGVELGRGVAGDEDAYAVEVIIPNPSPRSFSIEYFNSSGVSLERVDDLGLVVPSSRTFSR